MALQNIAKFNWEKIVQKVDHPDVLRSINLLRAKSNEILSTASKLEQEPGKIDFDSYKKNLKFTASAVTTLENAYKNKKLPQYHATVTAFEASKRTSSLSVVKSIVDAAKADLNLLNAQLDEFEKNKISRDTTYGDIRGRFPQYAKEIETEINNHEWAK